MDQTQQKTYSATRKCLKGVLHTNHQHHHHHHHHRRRRRHHHHHHHHRRRRHHHHHHHRRRRRHHHHRYCYYFCFLNAAETLKLVLSELTFDIRELVIRWDL